MTKEYYRKNNLTNKEEYSIVLDRISKVNSLSPATDYNSLRANSYSLLSIYEDLTIAHDTIIDRKMDEMLSPYLDDKKA